MIDHPRDDEPVTPDGLVAVPDDGDELVTCADWCPVELPDEEE